MSHADTTSTAYIALGANLGDAQATLRSVFDELAALPETTLLASSSLYRSPPFGKHADGPDYVNAVASIHTTLSPHALLDQLQAIEQAHGRERHYQNAPRTLDLDILLYSDIVLHDERLSIPHPRMSERAFVLLPLSELSPNLVWMNARGEKAELQHLLLNTSSQVCEKID